MILQSSFINNFSPLLNSVYGKVLYQSNTIIIIIISNAKHLTNMSFSPCSVGKICQMDLTIIEQ